MLGYGYGYPLTRSGASMPAWQRILSLAAADGAGDVYDAGNPTTRPDMRESEGTLFFTRLQGGLGTYAELTEATDANQPWLTGVGGLGYLTFNAGPHRIGRTTGAIPQPHTMIIVAQSNNGNEFANFVDGRGTSNRHTVGPSGGDGAGGTNTWRLFAGTLQPAANDIRDGNLHVFTAVFDTADVLRIDGAQVISADAGALVMDGFGLGAGITGAGQLLIGKIAVVVSYQSALGAAAVERMEDLLASIYPIGTQV